MTNKAKILMVIVSVISLDYFYGFDARFTIVNFVWCIPFVYAILIKKEK